MERIIGKAIRSEGEKVYRCEYQEESVFLFSCSWKQSKVLLKYILSLSDE